jgi:hypothetical protein
VNDTEKWATSKRILRTAALNNEKRNETSNVANLMSGTGAAKTCDMKTMESGPSSDQFLPDVSIKILHTSFFACYMSRPYNPL